MKLTADCHLHTLSSGHAYSTLSEYAKEASEVGLELIAMTDHGPKMPGSANTLYFGNLVVLPDRMHNVEILKGMEANIIDFNGSLDTDDIDYENLDVIISSFHTPCLKPSTKKENTRTIIKSLSNRYVNIIGHPDDSRVELDYPELARAAADEGVLIEVNSSSLKETSFRENAAENYKRLFEECVKHNLYLIVNSDAHIHTDVGNCTRALDLIKKLQYPEQLIANTSVEKLKERLFLRRK